MDMSAVALYNRKDPYADVRREEAAKQCLFFRVWTYLHHVPKLSTEESINALKNVRYKVFRYPILTGTYDKEAASGESKRRPSAAGFTDLPIGSKTAIQAVRRDSREEVEYARESAAHIDALTSLAESSAERNTMKRAQNEVACWSHTHVRATPEGEKWTRGQLHGRLRVLSAAACGAATTEVEDGAEDVEVVEPPLRDGADDQTPDLAASAAACSAFLQAAVEDSRQSRGVRCGQSSR